MTISDIRLTVLEVVNECFRKLGLSEVSNLNANKLSVQMLDHINDICNEMSDFGNWQEMIVSGNITPVSGQRDYSVTTSANIKNIGDIYYTSRSGPMRFVTIQEMRQITRVSGVAGTPSQFTVFGTDSNGNPVIRVNPYPSTPQNGEVFSLIYYIRCPLYTTSDANTLIPFPGSIVTDGALAAYILNESGGAPTDQYSKLQQDYESGRKEALNRFNGDTGWSVSFSPERFGRY